MEKDMTVARSPRTAHLFLVVLACALTVPAGRLAADTPYQLPDPVLVDLVDRPPTPLVRTSPDDEWLLLLQPPSLPSIAELAEEELRLAGLRFKPQNNGPSRRRPFVSLELVRVADGSRRPITNLPAEARLDDVTFSPDGSRIAFTHTRADGIELWMAEVATGEAQRLADARLNLIGRSDLVWLSDSRSLVTTLVPESRGAAPTPPQLPKGPVIQEHAGSEAPARTFQDLLENAHDEALFEHYLTSQLARVSVDGEVTPLGRPGPIWSFDASPDGRFFLVETLHRPFSYLVPAFRFPRRVEVWDAEGKLVKEIADLPLHENVPMAFGSVPTGPRQHAWRADAGATLVWAEALDGGDAGSEAEVRDQLYLLAAPFAGEPRSWAKLEKRFDEIRWGRDDLALVYETWWKTRNVRVSRLRPGRPEAAPELLIDRSWENRYDDPGRPLTKTGALGREVLRTGPGGETLFLVGEGASPQGNRPFFDVFDLGSRETRRIFRSEAPYYESPIGPIDDEGRFVLTRRESVEEPPNYFVRDLGTEDGALRRLTAFEHPTPELRGLYKELVRYRRDDGVQLTATLYLPPGHGPGDGPLPMLLWAYPREFKDAQAAGQVKDSPYQFDRISWSSPLLWLAVGYAVLDDPTMPIVGEGDAEPNDTFRKQLVASAKAAVDEMVRRGVTEPGRIAIGGHSYGAFMTANLLAHSDLFAAGIARSGAYNRTLTPFGFQSEERSYWKAPGVYFEMSPFMHAEKVNEPILLIHGAADNNSGTFPMQSERYYNALKGHGATARLVMLPHESHGYRARESVLHMLWETGQWLEKYVRNGAGDVPEVTRGAADRGNL
jgi:dipeptidyl aminopeptidase/acylaminoacyl peptidase